MPKLPVVTCREMIQILESLGWIESRQRGSHKRFIHPERLGLNVTVAGHGNQELHPRTLKSILSQADMTVEELRQLL